MKVILGLLARSIVFLNALIVFLPALADARPTVYYVSQSNGDDGHDGQAAVFDGTHGPWRTLAKATSVAYQPGDQLLLRCGDIWHETLTLRGDGVADSPVTVTSYGTGQRPLICGNRANYSACLIIDKASHYCIRDLEMESAQHAIRIVVDSRATAAPAGYRIEDCFLHDIVGPTFPDLTNKDVYTHNGLRDLGWAIFIDGLGSPEPVRLKDLIVRHCVGLRTQAFFIQMGAVSLEDITFDGNTIAHSSFNSVYQAGARNFDITNCAFVYSYPWEYHPNGATQVLAGGLTADGAVRNEVIGNEFGWAGDYPGCPDGCAYDFEGSTAGVTFQQNFIHDTFGESVLFMPNCRHQDLLFDGNIFRNNVRFSPRWNMEVTLFPNNAGNGTFSNNVFFALPGKRIINSQPAGFTFTNNVEQAAGTFVQMPLVTDIAYAEGMRTYRLASQTEGAAIRYTLDGSLPGPSSTLYSGPIALSRSGVLNAKAFKDGCYPSCVNCLGVELRDQKGADAVAQGDALPSIADTFTISLWAEPRAERASTQEADSGTSGVSGQRYALFPRHLGDSGDAGVGVSVGTNGISVYEHAADYLPALLVDNCTLSGWNHITVVYRNRQPTLYLNGLYEKAGCQSTKTVRPAFDVGDSDYGWYDGQVSAIRVYDRALTDAEIQVLATRRRE